MDDEPKYGEPALSQTMRDVLNISGDLVPELDEVLEELLERGKRERVMILAGTEGGRHRRPYAVTRVEIAFDNERDLRSCVRMLRWSDDRLRARPDQMILWDWQRTFREGMKIHFGVAWYDQAFFERRKDAFKEPAHVGYYSLFGATADRFSMEHEILG
jgi:hypothetical protein